MEFQAYIESNRGKKPNQEIAERWQNRIVARGLQLQGERGAKQYLADYGKGIAASKCILLAIQAERQGFGEMAMGFWRKAFELETGCTAIGGIAANTAALPSIQAPETPLVPEFPTVFQPGGLVTMQPEDALHDREFYITNPSYWGQPKRDGNKVVVFATPTQVWYQSRSMKLRPSPGIEFSTAIVKTAGEIGPFILEGELYFLDFAGKEHRTSAQAAFTNIEMGHGNVMPLMIYAVFASLYWKLHSSSVQSDRIANGCAIAYVLNNKLPGTFETLLPAYREEDKRKLVEKQRSEGREGEIWFHSGMDYRGGKRKDDLYVRTKYIIEMEAIVVGLTPTTTQGRPFGALEMRNLDNKPIGQIGTGFDAEQMRQIKEKFDREGSVRVTIATQGFTEAGNLFLGRFVDFV